MIQSVSFIGVTSLLLIEGYVLSRGILGRECKTINFSLALTISLIINLLLVLTLTIIHIPVQGSVLIAGQVAVCIAVLLICKEPLFKGKSTIENSDLQSKYSAQSIFLSLLLLIIGFYGTSHSVLLPTNQYDSFTHWVIRSKISFSDSRLAFDENRERGMRQPQYPVFLHSLHLAANSINRNWSDRSANSMQLLLTLSMTSSLFLLMKRLNAHAALLATGLIVSVPLMATHFAQGYADITLALFLSLSALSLVLFRREQSTRWLWISSLTVLGAAMTKMEGLLFGVMPWTLLIMYSIIKVPSDRNQLLLACLPPIAISTLWLLSMYSMNLSVSPESTDFIIEWHPEGIFSLFEALFLRGSFGILWFTLPLLLVLQRSWRGEGSPVVLWGAFVFAEIIFIYLCTPNVTFLINGQAFDRQILSVLMLLIIGWSLNAKRTENSTKGAFVGG